jgi:hypothetical protein
MTELNYRWTPTANRTEYNKSIHISHRLRSLVSSPPPPILIQSPQRCDSHHHCPGQMEAFMCSLCAAMLATLQHFCRQYVAITKGMFYADRLTMSTWRQRTTQSVPNQYQKSSKCYDPPTGMIVSEGTVWNSSKSFSTSQSNSPQVI